MMKSSDSAGLDRISLLSNNLLHDILSMLDMKQVAQTSILSKRWRYLWKSVSSLNFDDETWIKGNGYGFISFVNDVLTLRDDSDIDRFCLISYRGCVINEIDAWIDIVLKKNVQEIHFEGDVLKFSLLQCLVNKVKSLKLIGVQILFDGKIECRNNNLGSSFSTLESFVMERCCTNNGIVSNSITMKAPQLKYLLVEGIASLTREIKICAENLLELYLIGRAHPRYSFENLPLLQKAHVDTKAHGFFEWENKLQIIKRLHNVKSLTLSAYDFQSPAELQIIWEKVPCFDNIRYIKVTDWSDRGYIHGLAELLFQRFPSIETLVLEKAQVQNFNISSNMDGKWEEGLLFHCRFYKLKSVEIQGIEGFENELKLLEFFLKNSPVLEEMTVTTTSAIAGDKLKELANFCKKIECLPRASSNVAMLCTVMELACHEI